MEGGDERDAAGEIGGGSVDVCSREGKNIVELVEGGCVDNSFLEGGVTGVEIFSVKGGGERDAGGEIGGGSVEVCSREGKNIELVEGGCVDDSSFEGRVTGVGEILCVEGGDESNVGGKIGEGSVVVCPEGKNVVELEGGCVDDSSLEGGATDVKMGGGGI